jgi:hypothetical protein
MQKALLIVVTIICCSIKYFPIFEITKLSEEVEFSELSLNDTAELFDTLADLEFIEFRYANNHCEDRAHAMSKTIADKGIKAGKAWIFVKGVFDNKYPKVLKIKDQNKIGKNGLITWKYHVAPVVMTSSGDTLVLDPSLCEQPVSLNTWFQKMNVKNDVDRDQVFFLIKDWKYQSYHSKDKHARLFEPWRLDKDFSSTKKGLCEGKICQIYLDEHIEADSLTRVKGKKFKKLPKSYRKRKKECLKKLDFLK